ncbi:unnamed protein product [Moneuplotes crassus]|uniref:DNA sliding clamp PCNA n=1 Tax=Euplotes crassus TaxID=5936 RepID=A0AAD1XSJ1_EUPCR|nr:unnamed protein product [Moneuplotes crassus]
MFEARLKSCSTFKKVFSYLQGLMDDLKISISPTGVIFSSIDSTNTLLVQLSIRREEFETFELDDSLNLWIKAVKFEKTLPLLGDQDDITLKIPAGAEKLTILSKSEGGKRKFNFEYQFDEEPEEDFQSPEIAYKNILSFSSSFFKENICEMSNLADKLIISVDEQQARLQFDHNGNFGTINLAINSAKYLEEDEDLTHNRTTYQGEIVTSLMYDIRHVKETTRVANLATRVVLKMEEDLPLLVEYQCDEYGTLQFFLAP